MRPIRPIVLLVLLGVAAGCSTDDGRDLAPAVAPLPVTTTTVPPTTAALPLQLFPPWTEGEPLPERYGCGTDVTAPALAWTDVPDGTVELAIAFAAGGSTEQVLVGIAPDVSGMSDVALPDGAFWWPPGDVDAAWTGACSDDPATEFTFTLYALNQQVEAADDTSVTDLVALLTMTAIDQASVTGQHTDVPPPT
jgi:phosphatidylethanolamine-binding protein (PEBP) family uncharacterized protein